jgi:hypothetical protein
MPSWPSSLPSFPLADKFQEQPPDTLLRTQMDAGPAKLRPRTTAGVRLLRLAYILSRAQVEALDQFYRADLSEGALAFGFTHPRTGGAVSCRFRAPPEYAAVNGDYFRASLSLEVLP